MAQFETLFGQHGNGIREMRGIHSLSRLSEKFQFVTSVLQAPQKLNGIR